jgi:hypothetical protein
MTLFDVELLRDYWAVHPPLGHMIAGFLGVKTTAAAPEPVAASQDQLAQLMALTGAPGVSGANAPSWEELHAKLGLGQPTFDPIELANQRP